MIKNWTKLGLITGLAAFTLLSCNKKTEETPQEETTVAVPEWDTLNLSDFRNYKADTIGKSWQEQDGVITLTGSGGGDLITKNQYESFELELEWNIAEGGNSGIFYHVVEADSLPYVWFSGPEMQVLDNERHPDAKIHKHRAGDNYDLQASSVETVKPAGEWNAARLVVNKGHVEHWLNGTKVVEFQLGSPEWIEQYKASKFKDMPLYGQAGSGYIAIQDHGDVVHFRNIRIKTL